MRYNKGIYQERSLPMYPLIRRYLRRVDVVYLLLCAACSAISIAVLVSIGQTQLGSNNKASVQLIASLLGLMLAVVFSTADYHALARAWPLHGVVAWGLVLPTLFLHNVNTGLVTIGYDAGGTSNYSWYRVGGMTFQPAELAKISFILTLALHLSQVRGQVNRPKNLLLLFVHVALPAAAIHVQGDDGTALVFLGIGLVMLYAGGLSHWLVAGGLAAGVVGGAALLLALIGLFTVLGWVVGLVCSALDDSSLRDEYHDRLYGMVMLDPVAFDDASTVDEGVFKQAAIWGTVYQVQNSGGSLDQYERDPDTGSALIPALEIDTYISNLLGPDYQVTEGTFSTAEFVYQYDEEKQAYYVPVTSSVALYTPTVEMISQKDGKRIVTVGYVPTATNNTTGELSLMAPTEPTKYMDYVFTRGENRQWYLTALRDSDMQVEVTPIPAPTDAVVDNMQNEEMGTSDAASTEPAPVPEEGAEVAPDAENLDDTGDTPAEG